MNSGNGRLDAIYLEHLHHRSVLRGGYWPIGVQACRVEAGQNGSVARSQRYAVNMGQVGDVVIGIDVVVVKVSAE